jgi:hypothetical protein
MMKVNIMNKEFGKSTAGDRLKRAHKLVLKEKNVSLKAFARTQIKLGLEESLVQDAKDWLASKSGALNLTRDKKTQDRITAEKIAKKATRGKKK